MKQNRLDMSIVSKEVKEESNKYKGLYLGRITSQYNNLYKVMTPNDEMLAEVSGRFKYLAMDDTDYPAVGDYVMVDRNVSDHSHAIIHHILSRTTKIERKKAGKTSESQLIATNIDTIFVCMSLNNDFNIRRMERYLSVVFASKAQPVIVLTKSDLCLDLVDQILEIQEIAKDVKIIITSSLNEVGIEALNEYIKPGTTVAFIGSSGVGKSTLINKIVGSDLLTTKQIREDDKGRHTSTRRELVVLDNQSMVIDTPGMRELGVIDVDIEQTFEDISDLASQCRFSDCTHTSEPGCAVLSAIDEGSLTKERLNSLKKLKKESKYNTLSAKELEKDKLNHMFSEIGGMKNVKKFMKEKRKNKY